MRFQTLFACIALATMAGRAEVIWIEAEKPATSKVTRHPWWYDQVKKAELSGGDFISHWDKDKVGEAEYRIEAGTAGRREFWVRANPIQSALSYSLNGGADTPITLEPAQQSVNIAADDKPDLRFLGVDQSRRCGVEAGREHAALPHDEREQSSRDDRLLRPEHGTISTEWHSQTG
jgi:hypothetical protein